MKTKKSQPKVIKKAFAKANILYSKQMRKVGVYPSIVHSVRVHDILKKYTNNVNVLAAGILHDTIEDTDYTPRQLEKDFGPKIAEIVKQVTEDKMPQMDKKESWPIRKKKYLENLKNNSMAALMVCCADKIDNLESLMRDYKDYGPSVLSSFNASIEQKFWYYGEALKIIKKRLRGPIVKKLERVYRQAKKLF